MGFEAIDAEAEAYSELLDEPWTGDEAARDAAKQRTHARVAFLEDAPTWLVGEEITVEEVGGLAAEIAAAFGNPAREVAVEVLPDDVLSITVDDGRWRTRAIGRCGLGPSGVGELLGALGRALAPRLHVGLVDAPRAATWLVGWRPWVLGKAIVIGLVRERFDVGSVDVTRERSTLPRLSISPEALWTRLQTDPTAARGADPAVLAVLAAGTRPGPGDTIVLGPRLDEDRPEASWEVLGALLEAAPERLPWAARLTRLDVGGGPEVSSALEGGHAWMFALPALEELVSGGAPSGDSSTLRRWEMMDCDWDSTPDLERLTALRELVWNGPVSWIPRCPTLEDLEIEEFTGDTLDLRETALVRLSLRTARSLAVLRLPPTVEVVEIGGARSLPDLAAFDGLSKLETLAISGALSMAGLEPLRTCPALVRLNVADAGRVTDLAPLGALSALEELTLARTPITSLAPLAGCGRLSQIAVTTAPIVDLLGLAELPLVRLSLTDCRSLASLRHLPATLVELAVSSPVLASLDGVANLPALTTLSIARCRGLGALDGVERLPALSSLDLRHCTGLTDLRALRRAPDLREVLVSGDLDLGEMPYRHRRSAIVRG